VAETSIPIFPANVMPISPRPTPRVRRYFRSTAVSVISGTLARAFDRGQSFFAPAASF